MSARRKNSKQTIEQAMDRILGTIHISGRQASKQPQQESLWYTFHPFTLHLRFWSTYTQMLNKEESS
ncbi:hypothetical protein [Aneurinibacillus uraniidurans]|uniref:hypothetical protein n=1 Tax=Aneurinibacillus uraniidurans TaxID=2966586 RepID=UPI00234ABD93|nr:hypothetical protein [Aneurinibacillus sp. B1]WCN37985.1 hypothetical protein PO771_00730 [Aneurinibacillus sp. B1]